MNVAPRPAQSVGLALMGGIAGDMWRLTPCCTPSWLSQSAMRLMRLGCSSTVKEGENVSSKTRDADGPRLQISVVLVLFASTVWASKLRHEAGKYIRADLRMAMATSSDGAADHQSEWATMRNLRNDAVSHSDGVTIRVRSRQHGTK